MNESAASVDCAVRHQDAIALLRGLPAASVQVIVTDPPYGIAYHSNYYVERNPHAPVAHDWNFRIAPFMQAACDALRDGGAMYLFTRWDVFPLWAPSVTHPLVLTNLIVWLKDNWSAGDLTGNFGYQYECVLFVTKGRHRIRSKRWPNVWAFPRIPAKQLQCSTEKPVPLLRRAIEASSEAGDLVVDPYCGSGSTGEAAVQAGRAFLGGDIDPDMVRLVCTRLHLSCPSLPHTAPVRLPECPVFGVVPPRPQDWGVHPEDLAYALGKEPRSL